MTGQNTQTFTAFDGQSHLSTGTPEAIAAFLKHSLKVEKPGSLLVFDNFTGRVVDFDLQGTQEEISAQLAYAAQRSRPADQTTTASPQGEQRGRGRPKLGVVAREVTLLPRHWAWLADQPGGASVALRKLVEKARKESTDTDSTRAANERAYNFMLAMAGDLPGYEEATRALFAGDREKFNSQTASWPRDIRTHASWLAFGRVKVSTEN